MSVVWGVLVSAVWGVLVSAVWGVLVSAVWGVLVSAVWGVLVSAVWGVLVPSRNTKTSVAQVGLGCVGCSLSQVLSGKCTLYQQLL